MRIESLLYRFYKLPQIYWRQRSCIQEIRQKGKAKVAFLLSSLPMWRAQRVYDLLASDSRFDVRPVLYPFPNYSEVQRKSNISELREYCEARALPFIDLSEESFPGTALREVFNPDIVFYPQPYNHLYNNDLDSTFFIGKLISYIPYSMHTCEEPWVFQNFLCNAAWRVFLQLDDHREEAAGVLYNKAKNVRVVGEPMADVFAEPAQTDPWKIQSVPKKRIIWAPHFSIVDKGWLCRDSFTWMSSFMSDLAEKFQDQIQFAFKPHPRLRTELEKHPDWGPDKTRDFYNRWAEGSNTQLETGPYTDLFKTSDAMIHDCGSFSVEYHFTGKPVMFVSRDINAAMSNQNAMGKEGIRAHYSGSCEKDILSFVENVVLAENDSMKPKRIAFHERYLRPPGGRSVADNIYREILSGIKFTVA